MSGRILCVDDEQSILTFLKRMAQQEKMEVTCAQNGAEGLKQIQDSGPFAVIISDLQMPEMDGIEFLAKARELSPESIRIMLTGHAEISTAVEAINKGRVFRFLTKPCDPEDLILVLRAALEQYRLEHAEKALLEKTLTGCVQVLMDLLAMMDEEIFGQSVALRAMVRSLAKRWNIKDSWELEISAMLMKIGMITLPPELQLKLKKGVPLDAAESELAQRIPQIGHDLVDNIPRMARVADNILYQSKWFNGTGFPTDAILGEQIPIGARILHALSEFLEQRVDKTNPISTFHGMMRNEGRFDPQILDFIYKGFGMPGSLTPPTQAPPPPKQLIMEIPLVDLKIGHVLADDIRTQDGRSVVTSGSEISGTQLAKIRNYSAGYGVIEPIKIFAAH
ncbi:MAG: response regulator [Candidatus Sumerlaeota bacterium]|nr:response regulator [Candidatus Sumerlaeota bacterium]